MDFRDYDTRVGAYALIFDGDSVLLTWWNGQGRPDWASWTLPGGGVELGEQVEGAVIREVFEETGFRVELDDYLTTHSWARMDDEHPALQRGADHLHGAHRRRNPRRGRGGRVDRAGRVGAAGQARQDRPARPVGGRCPRHLAAPQLSPVSPRRPGPPGRGRRRPPRPGARAGGDAPLHGPPRPTPVTGLLPLVGVGHPERQVAGGPVRPSLGNRQRLLEVGEREAGARLVQLPEQRLGDDLVEGLSGPPTCPLGKVTLAVGKALQHGQQPALGQLEATGGGRQRRVHEHHRLLRGGDQRARSPALLWATSTSADPASARQARRWRWHRSACPPRRRRPCGRRPSASRRAAGRPSPGAAGWAG
ncbi:NUDIX hydrolase [Tessaracoccus coleopterorum]|uniref:NUDIX hydrolase n=1 Tax=Tessaracoccus coleopterorum TaxID=2714950 RepID=UPI0018D498BD